MELDSKGVNTIQKDTITYLPDALKCELKVALRERNSCARCWLYLDNTLYAKLHHHKYLFARWQSLDKHS